MKRLTQALTSKRPIAVSILRNNKGRPGIGNVGWPGMAKKIDSHFKDAPEDATVDDLALWYLPLYGLFIHGNAVLLEGADGILVSVARRTMEKVDKLRKNYGSDTDPIFIALGKLYNNLSELVNKAKKIVDAFAKSARDGSPVSVVVNVDVAKMVRDKLPLNTIVTTLSGLFYECQYSEYHDLTPLAFPNNQKFFEFTRINDTLFDMVDTYTRHLPPKVVRNTVTRPGANIKTYCEAASYQGAKSNNTFPSMCVYMYRNKNGGITLSHQRTNQLGSIVTKFYAMDHPKVKGESSAGEVRTVKVIKLSKYVCSMEGLSEDEYHKSAAYLGAMRSDELSAYDPKLLTDYLDRIFDNVVVLVPKLTPVLKKEFYTHFCSQFFYTVYTNKMTGIMQQ